MANQIAEQQSRDIGGMYTRLECNTMAICASKPKPMQKWQKLSKAKRVELKRSEALLAYPEVAIRFYLMHILIAIIAFLWDASCNPFDQTLFSIFS